MDPLTCKQPLSVSKAAYSLKVYIRTVKKPIMEWL